MSYENISFATEDHIAIVTLNRPQRRNALSLALMRALIACLNEVGQRREIRAVILAASGRAFCSGHDLTEMVGRGLEDYRELFGVCTELMAKVQSIAQPVIAEVQGVATAAGCQLVASCDLAIAAEEAMFATPGVKIGLFCTTPMVAVSRAVGRKRAMEMLLTGDSIDAHTAAEWGLVNRVVPAGQLRAETLKLARRVSESSDVVVGLGKQAYYAQIDLPQAEAYVHAQDVMSRNAVADDAQEGIGAFLEKRAARWTGGE